MTDSTKVFVVFTFLVACCNAFVPTPSNYLNYTSGIDLEDKNATQRCGGILEGKVNEIQGVQYKAFDALFYEERCVWTVRAESANGFDVNLIYLGYETQNDNQSVIFTGLLSTQDDPLIVHHVPESMGEFHIKGNVLVITFQTSAARLLHRTGFIASVTPKLNYSLPRASRVSVDKVGASAVGAVSRIFSYNQEYELSTFLFMPYDNYHVAGRRTDVFYMRDSAVHECSDYLTVYKFNHSSETSHKWEDMGRFCEDSDLELISSEDIMLIVFRVGSKGYRYNFKFSYSRCN